MKSKDTASRAFSKPSPGQAMDRTTQVAREIIASETSRRDTLTAQLREARLARDAENPAPAPKKKPARKSGSGTAR